MSKTPTPRRVYAVHHAGTGATRLVRAVNVATAVRHVVRTDYTAEVASQDGLICLLSAGVRVEDAGADDLGEPPVKVLRFTAAAAEPPPERDPRVPDMFDDVPAAPVSPVVGAVVDVGWVPFVDSRREPLAAGGFAPCGRALGDCGKATQTCGRDGCGAEVVEMPPQHAPIAAAPEDLASGELAEPAALAASATAGVALGSSESGVDGAPAAPDETELKRQAEAAAARAGGKIVAKYRDPATGQTWSGRGLKPRWLVQAIEAGQSPDDYLIENQGAQA